jgi:hypothetical protein
MLVDTQEGQKVRLDRGAVEILVPYNPVRWVPAEKPPLDPTQVASVAWAADMALRRVKGEYRVSDWISLRDQERMAFIGNGPITDDKQRRELYAAIVGVLK